MCSAEVALQALRLRIEQMEMAVYSPGSSFAVDGSKSTENLVQRVRRDLAEAQEVMYNLVTLDSNIHYDLIFLLQRAFTEFEVNQHIDATRFESRLQHTTERLDSLESAVMKEQENSVKLLEALLTRRKKK